MDPIKDFIEIVKPAKAQTHQNLVLFPLLAPESGDPDYLTLEEALQAEAVVITEINEGGNVPELKLVNRSESRILILDGEELKGAKQNRIVNTTILVAAYSTLVIPVSCVEQGRWSYDSPRFASRERILPNRIRAQKAQQVQFSLRQSREFRANQGAIWDEIADKADRMEARSPRHHRRGKRADCRGVLWVRRDPEGMVVQNCPSGHD